MSDFIKMTIERSDGSELLIEGFGPATILGALDDVLSGAYSAEGYVRHVVISLPRPQDA